MAEDFLDLLSLGEVDDEAPALGVYVVAERGRPAGPEPLATGGSDLVPGAVGDGLALELGEAQQDVQHQPPGRVPGVERLSNGRQGHVVGVEDLDQLHEVRQGARQTV